MKWNPRPHLNAAASCCRLPEVACLLTTVFLLAGLPARAQESVRAFGLEFTVISNAVIDFDPAYAALQVTQLGNPACDYNSGDTNDPPPAPFGISVLLGEAQSGVFIYPNAECREDNRSMWGHAYGNVNGQTNRLISSVKGTRVGWGNYSIEVDMTPLGATGYTYQVWSHGAILLQATNAGPLSAIDTLSVEDYDPRVNPIFLTDAGPAVVIDFPDGTMFGIASDQCTGCIGRAAVGDRFLIIAEGATNQIDHASRVDVFGSENLPSFAVQDARLGMFGRPHKALGSANLSAANARLTVAPFEAAGSEGPTNGVLVDFKNGAVRWAVQTEPFALQQTNAGLLLSALALGAFERPSTTYVGPAGFTKANGIVSLHANFTQINASNSVLRVFRDDSLVGSIQGAFSNALASLAQTNPLVIGWSATLDGFSFSLAEVALITGHEGTQLEGDRFEFAPLASPVRLGRFHSADVRGHGIDAITITSEVTEDAPLPELRLTIAGLPPDLVVSWPHHPEFYLLSRTNLMMGHSIAESWRDMVFDDFRWYLPVNPTNTMKVYSLIHRYSYYLTP